MPRPGASPSPPPANFSYMSGNFDYPRARSSRADPEARNAAEHIREAYARITRGLPRVQEQERVNSAGESAQVPMSSQGARTRRSARQAPPPNRDSDSAPSQAPPSSADNRPRATPSLQYLRRSRVRLRERPVMEAPDSAGRPGQHPAMSALTNANRPRSAANALRALADDSETTRQAKRRKLEHGSDQVSPWDGFKYGAKGQLVPGRLKMEIVSCDGGEYVSDQDPYYGLHSVQHVLKNDKSVYCSARSRCNLLLKHIGEMPFTLEKVVIRAPNRGYTAPVQEGLVFVAMTSDDILTGTASYKIEYDSPSPPASPRLSSPSSDDDQLLSLQEAIGDPYVWENTTQGRQQSIEDRIRNRRHQMEHALYANRIRRREEREHDAAEDDMVGDVCEDLEEDEDAAAAGISAPTPPPYTVTTESEEESDGEDELPSEAVLADRLRRESRMSADGDEYGDAIRPRRYLLDGWATSNRDARDAWRRERMGPIRARRRETPSRIEPKEGAESEARIEPHAKFFIAKHKSKITIKFHPHISGKFVLLKLWSPTQDGNIDIESVQFYGYSGPRYFPAAQPA